MTTVQVFDPALCCDTDICGETVDQQLVRFGEDLAWLSAEGVIVQDYLQWSEDSRAMLIGRRVCGVLVLAGGLCFLYTAR